MIYAMGKSAKKPVPKGHFKRWFLREWRKHRHLTLAQLAARVDTTEATVSRLERGLQPYSQPMLEALADALTCRPGDLITRPPGASDQIMAVLNDMSPEAQKHALAAVEAIRNSDKAA